MERLGRRELRVLMRTEALSPPPPVAWLLRAWYTASREVLLAASTRRGRLLAAALAVCFMLPSGIRLWTDSMVLRAGLPVASRQQLSAITNVYGAEVASALSPYPAQLVALSLLSILSLPLVLLIAGHDGISRDIAERRARLTRLRTPPGAFLLGKFFGLWANVSLILLGLHLAMALLITVKSPGATTPVLVAGLRLWLACAAVALPYSALCTAVSASTASAPRSLIIAFTLIVLLAFAKAANVVGPDLAPWLLPSANDGVLLRRDAAAAALAMGRAVAWTVACLLLGTFILRRREL